MYIKFTPSLLVSILFVLVSCKNASTATDWKQQTIGTMGLSVEAPFEFSEKNIENQLTPSVRKMINKMETFFHEGKGNYYAINTAEYANDVNFSTEAAVNGALADIKNRTGGELSNRTDEKKQLNGQEAAITRATITDTKDNPMEFQMAILNKGQKIFQVMCLYKQGSNDNAKTASRILESINLK